eukprot:332938_1
MSTKNMSNYSWKSYSRPQDIPCPPLNPILISEGSIMIQKNGRGRGTKIIKEHKYIIYQGLERNEWIEWAQTSNLEFNAALSEIYKIYIKSIAHTALKTQDEVLSHFISNYLKLLLK